MRLLQLSPENRAKVDVVVEFASRPENVFDIAKAEFIPGDRPEYTVDVDTYRCVFTISCIDGLRFRHLSMSVRGERGALPNRLAAFTIATWFGFTGATMEKDVAVKPGPYWSYSSVEHPMHCVVFAEPLTIGASVDMPEA